MVGVVFGLIEKRRRIRLKWLLQDSPVNQEDTPPMGKHNVVEWSGRETSSDEPTELIRDGAR